MNKKNEKGSKSSYVIYCSSFSADSLQLGWLYGVNNKTPLTLTQWSHWHHLIFSHAIISAKSQPYLKVDFTYSSEVLMDLIDGKNGVQQSCDPANLETSWKTRVLSNFHTKSFEMFLKISQRYIFAKINQFKKNTKILKTFVWTLKIIFLHFEKLHSV